MPEKIKWGKFAFKCWNNGIGTALKEEVVPKTTNKIDDVVVGLVNSIVERLGGEEESKVE